MKFGKDEIQKIALSVLLLAGLLYGYFGFLLTPLRQKQENAARRVAELTPKIRAAKGQLARTAALENEAPAATERFDQITALIPEGAPIAWFPPRLVNFFQRQGIEQAAVRLAREADAPAELGNFRRLTWIVDLRNVQFVPLGIAIAGLENEEPLLLIEQLRVESSQTDVETQHVILSVSNLVNK